MGKRRPVSLLSSLPPDIRADILNKRLDDTTNNNGKNSERQTRYEGMQIDYESLLSGVERYGCIDHVPDHLKKCTSLTHPFLHPLTHSQTTPNAHASSPSTPKAAS